MSSHLPDPQLPEKYLVVLDRDDRALGLGQSPADRVAFAAVSFRKDDTDRQTLSLAFRERVTRAVRRPEFRPSSRPYRPQPARRLLPDRSAD